MNQSKSRRLFRQTGGPVKPGRATSRSQAGFTLLETLLSLMIFASGLLLVNSSWSGSFLRLNKTKFNVEVAALLQRKIVEVENEFRGKPLESIWDEKEEDFGSDYKNYKWRVESKQLEVPDLSSILAANSDEGTPESVTAMMKQFTEQLGKAIKEVKITVTYTGGKKPTEFSSTIYFIDYEKGLTAPGADGATQDPADSQQDPPAGDQK